MSCGASERTHLRLVAQAPRLCAVAHKRTAGARRAAEIVTVLALVSLTRTASATEAAFSYRNPFHPEQCERAIRFAEQQLVQNPSSAKARMVLAEGLLCRGLDDDPDSLDESIALLREIVREDPSDFFAQLDLSDALRRRFPLSAAAERTATRARILLDHADLGAAADDLRQYIEENVAAVVAGRADAQPLLQRSAATGVADTLSPSAMRQFLGVLALTGPDGLAGAATATERVTPVRGSATREAVCDEAR